MQTTATVAGRILTAEDQRRLAEETTESIGGILESDPNRL